MSNKLIINLCPTGMIPRKADTPHVPLSPVEIADDVKRCYEAGVSMVHLHARDINENPCWQPEIFQEILDLVHQKVPDIVLIVTTSGRNWPEIEKRSAVLKLDNFIKPEMASLTLGSMNFPKNASINSPDTIKDLAIIMRENNIVPELEVFDVGMANYSKYLIDKEILKPPFYFNILLGSLGAAELSPANLAAILSSLPPHATWALAGIGHYQLAANTMAIALGGHVRVGLEDNPYYDWKTRSNASNLKLVERVVRIAREFGREPASPQEARAIIGLKNCFKSEKIELEKCDAS